MKLLKHDVRVASLRMTESDAEVVLHADPDLPDQAVYYLVDDVRAIYKKRADLRLTFAHPPTPVSKGYSATAKDPFGNVLLLLDRHLRGRDALATLVSQVLTFDYLGSLVV